jgi:hypothetical protein
VASGTSGTKIQKGVVVPPPLLVADGPNYFFLVAFFGEAFFAFFIWVIPPLIG